MYVVSKGIIDAHGGTLSVYSAGEGCGSTFSIQLPGGDRNCNSAGDGLPQLIEEKSLSWIPRRTFAQIFAGTENDNQFSSIKYSHNSSETCGHIRKVSKVAVHNTLHSPHQSSPGARNVSGCNYELSNSSLVECDKDDDELSSVASILDEVVDKIKVYKTLIVDDSLLSRNMLARLLRSRCGNCDEAEDGIKAIEMVKVSLDNGKPYDVILMDSEMPNMNGPEAAEYIKTQLGYTGLVVGVTGNALPEDISNFKAHGADDVLVKPIKVSQFDEVLNRIFENQILQALSDE